jgi:ubiquinone biosynthesis protein COQ4
MVPFHFDVPRGARALRALLKDPDDLPQVFTLIESLSGTAPIRLLRGFEKRENGRRLLREKPDIVRILADRERLRALPPGSLGRAYLAFVETENLSAEGIRTASAEGYSERPHDPEIEWIANRMRDTHDLWHALTGYRGDVLGELALLAFTLGQHWNSAVALIVLGGLIKGFGHADPRLVLDGFRRGRAAAWLPPVDWEPLLERPLHEVRALLRVELAPAYTPLRTADLRAQGLV